MTVCIEPYPGGFLARLAQRAVRLLKGPGAASPSRRRDQHDHHGETTVARMVRARAAVPDSRLLKVFAGAQKFQGLRVYVHGSWADGTTNAFSDLDDFIVIDPGGMDRSSARKLVAWLNRVDMRMCRLDPLQHHGHWMTVVDALRNYDESSMPLAALEGSICIHGPADLEVIVCPACSQGGYQRTLRALIADVERLFPRYQAGRINLYQMKALVSATLLIPALLRQVDGDATDKRSAILLASNSFSATACEAITVCSQIRELWGSALDTAGYQLFQALPLLFSNPHLFRKIANRWSPRYPAERLPPLAAPAIAALITEAKARLD